MLNWTIQSLIDGNMTLRAYCHDPACAHSQRLDLMKLRDRLGPDAPAMAVDLEPRLRCSKCGGRKVGLRYAPDAEKVFGMAGPGKNLYAKAKGN